MSEPAADGEEVLVPQPSSATETVEEEETKQVVDGDAAAEESRPEQVEAEVQQQEVVEEKVESAPEDLKVEMQPEVEEGERESPEEQQQQPNQEEREEPEKAMDDSQDTVQMPISDTPERALEDEEMPSMVTISSTSRIDESETYNKQDETEPDNKQDEDPKFAEVEKYSPKPVVAQEKDSDSDSVCVIDDDDDEEEQNDYDEEEEMIRRNDRRRVRYNDDDDDEGETSYDDEYDGSSSYDSDDVDDEERYNDKHDRRYQRNSRRDVDDDVEDDDEDDEDGENEDEYMDDRDFGGGGSDDAILRPNTNGLSKQQKERSSSLQDLSLIQGPSPKSRQNVNPFSQKAIFERNQGKGKYAHVPSKVKKYIDDGAEQRRISIERRKKSIDEMRQKSEEPTEIQIQRSEEIAMACQTMKNYAEKTLKEVAECEENEKMLFLQQGVENGEISLIPRQLMSSHTVEPVNKANEMEIDLIDEDDEKRPTTFNGTAPKENQNNFVTERKGIMRREDGPPKSSIFNGEDPLSFQQPIDNLRTLSYDEYMKGPVSTLNEVVVNRIDVSEVQSIAMQEAEIEDDSGLRIESVVSNYSSEKVIEDFQNRKTPPIMVHQSTETFYQENPELLSLRAQLNQRNQQFENLREAYQKNMSDSMAMKIELENLRKAVAYYQEQLRSPRVETKVSAVQTEVPAGSRDMPLIDLDGNDAKLGVSQVSTQWSDGTGSVTTISMDPPNVTNALNSDESAQPKTPLPKRNALSRAFMTSTKILQTLSSITHGKTKVDKFAKPKVQEVTKPSKPGPASSKKRKASDAMDDSTQPTKIAKSNDQEGIEPTTPTSQFVNPNAVEQENAEKKNEERPAEESSSDDDVKVYVYPEDEEGHEHSFLIQAKEVSENPKPGVRECGPYLLGNVEVYMTEVNGTINIWGKELSQTSQSTAEATDLDASARSRDLHQNLRWQSTPRIFNKHEQQVSASTGKKSRLLPRYLQPSTSRPEQPHQCEHSQRLSWPSCHEHQYHQHQHACCGNAPPVVPATSCGCVHEQKRAVSSCCMTKSMPNMNQNCCCSGHVKPLARRHSFNPTDEEDSDEEDDVNRTLLADDYSPHSFSKSKASHQHTASEPRRSTGGSSNDPSMCENESDPLIAARQAMDGMEGPEKRRKKKVRGILMDLLRKGCAGDCRPNPLDKSNLHHTTSIYEPSTSAQHKAPCLPGQPSHSHRPNERYSSCCSKQPDKTSQIEAQMERFREEMDKLRSQSDTLAGMIQALKNADVID